jgi:hypothetical protein
VITFGQAVGRVETKIARYAAQAKALEAENGETMLSMQLKRDAEAFQFLLDYVRARP